MAIHVVTPNTLAQLSRTDQLPPATDMIEASSTRVLLKETPEKKVLPRSRTVQKYPVIENLPNFICDCLDEKSARRCIKPRPRPWKLRPQNAQKTPKKPCLAQALRPEESRSLNCKSFLRARPAAEPPTRYYKPYVVHFTARSRMTLYSAKPLDSFKHHAITEEPARSGSVQRLSRPLRTFFSNAQRPSTRSVNRTLQAVTQAY